MEYPVFIMLVGLPGSGKSTWANSLRDKYVVHSSDVIKEELFGDEGHECTPEEDAQVFKLLHERVKRDLKANKNVIYDATNLNKRRRAHFLKELKKIRCVKNCVLFATDYEICIEQNNKRTRQIPEDAIWRLYSGFQPPHKSEGWNKIEIIYNVDFTKYPANRADLLTMDFDQENKHHALTLGKHMLETGKYVKKRSRDSALQCAAAFHDIGKLKTKSRGEDGECHYHNHHSIGAYDAIFYVAGGYLDIFKGKEIKNLNSKILQVSNFIYYHMHPYMSWEQSEKARKRDKRLLGEEMFEKIMLLHEGDLAAH